MPKKPATYGGGGGFSWMSLSPKFKKAKVQLSYEDYTRYRALITTHLRSKMATLDGFLVLETFSCGRLVPQNAR